MNMEMRMEMRMEPARGSRRKRLWEVDSSCHCPIVGVCFDLPQIRKLVIKHLHLDAHASDFDVHVAAVRECGERNALSEALHKDLERRYALTIQQFRALRDEDELLSAWRQAVDDGRFAPALWTTITHPACGPMVARQLYGQVHMLQHQVGACRRIDAGELQTLRATQTMLRRELAAVESELIDARTARSAEIERLKLALSEARAHVARQEGVCARYQGELDALKAAVPEFDKLSAIAKRARDAEAMCRTLKLQRQEQEAALMQARAQIERLERVLGQALHSAAGEDPHDTARQRTVLTGRHVLCVGGRIGAATLYRDLVERLGGQFTHHDGGLEENIARLDASIAAADAVICQAGCISHNAYWRVKEHCKRTGKTCVFLKTPGLTAFLGGLDALQDAPAAASTVGPEHSPR